MKKSLLSALLTNVLFWTTTTFFIPLNLFLANRLEMTATLTTMIVEMMIITLVGIAAGTLITFFLPQKAFSPILALLSVLGVLVWFKSNILVINYGVLDGQSINWNDYKLHGIADIILWITVIILAIKFHKIVVKHIKLTAASLILIQAISFGISIYNSPTTIPVKGLDFDYKSQFALSTQSNVVLIILDTFQTNYFDYILKEYPEYKNDLPGFTYFPNATGGFTTTAPSVPLILTGQYYDNSQEILKFAESAFNSNSLPKFLKENNYETNIFPLAEGSIKNEILTISPTIADNIKLETAPAIFSTDNKTLELLYLTWFRAAPQFLKPDTDFLVQILAPQEHPTDTLGFVKQFKHTIKADNIAPQFKFYHLWGLHSPLTTNEELSYEEMSYNPLNYTRAAKGHLEMIKEFITALKNEHIYDQTMIVIVGDHGAGFPIGTGSENQDIAETIRARALPLFLVKPFYSDAPLLTKSTPVSLEDVYKTIASQIAPEKTKDIPGLDVLDNNFPIDRERKYFYYHGSLGVWVKRHNSLPEMRRYLINGHSWDPNAWKDTREIYAPEGHKKTVNTDYVLAEIINFSEVSSQKYLDGGWSHTEPEGIWSLGSEASIELNKLPPNQNLMLTINFSAFTKQNIEIILNNNPIKQVKVGSRMSHSVKLPSQFIKGKNDTIKFRISSPKSPIELGLSKDDRQLGILLKTLTVSGI
ncbi:sulfatase-like hydrolase/transferase [Candidatus Gracilibacteria bacterium]|nr:sulfatase-like hydrolase/transferase [Candidatus Gracilibacteria bacterium]